MLASFKGCLVKSAVVVVVLLIAYAGWRWGSAVFPKAEAMLGIERLEEGRVEPTLEAGEEAMARLQQFSESSESEVRLEGYEISSLLRHVVPGVLPRGVLDPEVFLAEDHLEIRANVVPSKMPNLPDLGRIVGILPDTVGVEVGGSLIPFGDRGSALVVSRMQAQGVPIPRRLLPDVLLSLGRKDAPGLPATAILVPVPPGARHAYIEQNQLILVR